MSSVMTSSSRACRHDQGVAAEVASEVALAAPLQAMATGQIPVGATSSPNEPEQEEDGNGQDEQADDALDVEEVAHRLVAVGEPSK